MIDSVTEKSQNEAMEINSYAAPQSKVFQATSEDELTRKAYIETEESIKSLSVLYYFGAPVLTALGAAPFAYKLPDKNALQLLAGGMLLMGIGMAVTAYGLSRLQSWSRITTIILSSIALIIGLINLPKGTLFYIFHVFHIFILVKMMGKRVQFVMTPEYQRIIAATPHVKWETSIGMKVLLVLLLIILIGIITSIKLSF